MVCSLFIISVSKNYLKFYQQIIMLKICLEKKIALRKFYIYYYLKSYYMFFSKAKTYYLFWSNLVKIYGRKMHLCNYKSVHDTQKGISTRTEFANILSHGVFRLQITSQYIRPMCIQVLKLKIFNSTQIK